MSWRALLMAASCWTCLIKAALGSEEAPREVFRESMIEVMGNDGEQGFSRVNSVELREFRSLKEYLLLTTIAPRASNSTPGRPWRRASDEPSPTGGA